MALTFVLTIVLTTAVHQASSGPPLIACTSGFLHPWGRCSHKPALPNVILLQIVHVFGALLGLMELLNALPGTVGCEHEHGNAYL
jgi:hypothetical protein